MRTQLKDVTKDTERAEVIGWVHEVRDLGGLSFYILRDRTGFLQATVVKKKAPETVIECAKSISRESVVRITGAVKATEKAPGGREIIPDNGDNKPGRDTAAA
jgi:aspartyl-tRNA synthetase